MRRNLSKQKGFTIVELLIVIVVIGILAAIVIVAYQGITQRAKATDYQTDAVAISKVAEAINADTSNGYPQTLAAFSPAGFTTSKLPSGVIPAFTTGTVTNTDASTNTPPTGLGTQTWATYADSSTGNIYYSVKACSGTTGLTVYYWTNSSTVGKRNAGTGC
ncbi:prepilin-type N-terminal cleavage/methylation domain-containing protein [Candidatus Saccharibacteria bacterium]|nr:prepilin-type N-terminal cleavage/methylation domain-containing protein [Candidatus Saccharibacteria bacterium]